MTITTHANPELGEGSTIVKRKRLSPTYMGCARSTSRMEDDQRDPAMKEIRATQREFEFLGQNYPATEMHLFIARIIYPELKEPLQKTLERSIETPLEANEFRKVILRDGTNRSVIVFRPINISNLYLLCPDVFAGTRIKQLKELASLAKIFDWDEDDLDHSD